jgi:site-specific DNA-methyltransferase (adenine-specific)
MKMLTNKLIESPEILPTTNAPYKIWTGDNLELLDQIPDCSVDSIVTDPPYGLGKEPDAMQLLKDWIESGVQVTKNGKGFMNKEWDAFVPQPMLWKKCLRVLKPGGHLLAFGGTRTYDLLVLGLRIAGFEIRDQIVWVFPNM